MFPNKIEHVDYDFLKADNFEKWKGTFANSLGKVLEQVHPSLQAAEEALQYVEALILTLMAKLCAKPSPHTVQDVEERVGKTFPNPIDKWALNDARESTAKNMKKKPVLPVDKIHHMLQKEVFVYKIDTLVTSFIVAIVEYIAADILKLAGNYVKKISNDGGFLPISSQDIKTSMNADKALMEMFYHEQVLRREKAEQEAALARPLKPSRTPRASLTYDELVRDLMSDEKQYLRDLHMIIRVFREEIEKILPKDSKDVEKIFGNIVEIYELTVTLLGSLEDTVESASETQMPHIGICFEELAEAEEFDVYVRYAQIVTTQASREALQAIVDNPELSERLDTGGHGFRLAVKYFLPKLLASPITHAFLYFDYVAMLLKLAPCTEDMESFQQVEGLMKPIQKSLLQALGNGPKIEAASRMASRARRQVALEKTNELTRLIDNWDTKDIGQCCNEFIREDTLGKVGPGRRVTERRAFLFDGLLLLCKPCTSDKTRQDLKLKERLYIRKLDMVDRPDTDEVRNCMELSPRCGTSVVLCCSGAVDKNLWMADLVMLNTKSMLDRTLDSILMDLERKHPLKLPPPSLYRFAVPDSADNILLEERHNAGVPLIKGATLLKLVERLTYHIYADPMFVRTFLTTYRSFCGPAELLDLLVERFQIPDPSLVYDVPEKPEAVAAETEKLSKNSTREDFKRYRKEFLQPVQFRVLNVLRHWVDQHYYDFERDPSLLEKLRTFLDSITGKPMKKWVESVIKIVHRKSGGSEARGLSPPAPEGMTAMVPAPVFDRVPPPLERAWPRPERVGWHILALHPIEVARQLTLLEFDMYRTVKPSELVGAVWTKKDKETSSPNLLRIIKHTTNFTRWIEKSIMEAENLEERAAVLCRALEVMMVLRELNNFNGVLAIVSAMGSASVYRLKFTFQMLAARTERALEECRDLNSDHFRRYQERLRSINPPCVPFCGMYLTNILHIEDGNRDFLPDSQLINFSKRRKVAEITGEIQQYQNQPYCLTVEPHLRNFLETLNPFPGMEDTEIRDYLYNKSLEIEPRLARQAPRFARKWPDMSLKSPGIKPARARHSQHCQPPAPPELGDDHSSISQLSPTLQWDSQSVLSFGSVFSLGADEDLSPRPPSKLPAALSRFSGMSSSATLNRDTDSGSLRSVETGPPVSPRPPPSPRLPPTPPPPPRSFPSPDHRTADFRSEWPADLVAGFADDSLPPRLSSISSSCEEKHHKIVNDIISNLGNNHSSCEVSPRPLKPPALSPRNPIVDSNVFYGKNDLGHDFEGTRKRVKSKSNGDTSGNPSDPGEPRSSKPPAISPRNCIARPNEDRNHFNLEVDRTNKPVLTSTRTNGDPTEDPPLIVPRWRGVSSSTDWNRTDCPKEQPNGNDCDSGMGPPPPPLRLPPASPRETEDGDLSPKRTGDVFGRLVEMSPKSTASSVNSDMYGHPPLSPHVNIPNSVQTFVSRYPGVAVPGDTFSFPPTVVGWPAPKPSPKPSPTVTSLTDVPHTPPPLPPRRPRDSTPPAFVPQPSPTLPLTLGGEGSTAVPAVPPRAGSPPPPVPPRPPGPPSLLRPAQSTILQRRHLSSFAAETPSPTPRLPPRPPASTVFLSPSVTHARQETP